MRKSNKMERLPDDVLELVLSCLHTSSFSHVVTLRTVSKTWNAVLMQTYVAPLLSETRAYLEAMMVLCASRRYLFQVLGRRKSDIEWGRYTAQYCWIDLIPGRCTGRTKCNTQCARRAIRNDSLQMCRLHRERIPFVSSQTHLT